MRVPLALPSQDIRVLSFARFDDTLSVLENTSSLTLPLDEAPELVGNQRVELRLLVRAPDLQSGAVAVLRIAQMIFDENSERMNPSRFHVLRKISPVDFQPRRRVN